MNSIQKIVIAVSLALIVMSGALYLTDRKLNLDKKSLAECVQAQLQRCEALPQHDPGATRRGLFDDYLYSDSGICQKIKDGDTSSCEAATSYITEGKTPLSKNLYFIAMIIVVAVGLVWLFRKKDIQEVSHQNQPNQIRSQQPSKSRSLLLIAAIAFLIIGFIRGGDAVTDILKSAGYLVGIVTLVLGIMRLNKELRQER